MVYHPSFGRVAVLSLLGSLYVIILTMMTTTMEVQLHNDRSQQQQQQEEGVWLPLPSSSSRSLQQHITMEPMSLLHVNNNHKALPSTAPLLPPHHPSETLGMCLLIKDDNDLLPEFIAYHYHAWDMRTLIVAVDPSSETSPVDILKRFQRDLPDFHYTIWYDDDYMNSHFLAGNYSGIPNFLGREYNTTTTIHSQSQWHTTSDQFQKATATKRTSNVDDDDAVIGATTVDTDQEVLQGINNHRYRQTVFVGKCLRYLYHQSQREKQKNRHRKIFVKTNNRTTLSYTRYMAHIDTDELLVINPIMLKRGDPRMTNVTLVEDTNIDNPSKTPSSTLPPPPPPPQQQRRPWETLEASSVRQLLGAWHRQYPFRNRACRYLPRLLMGAIERYPDPDDDVIHSVIPIDPSLIPPGFDAQKFESLRYKWHAAFTDNPHNGFGKVVLDMDELRPKRDRILEHNRRASGIHQISPQLCTLDSFADLWKDRPLATYHYLGSAQRYLKKDDPRRSLEKHNKKSAVASKLPDGPWLDQWLFKFVQVHGLAKSRRLLPEYLL